MIAVVKADVTIQQGTKPVALQTERTHCRRANPRSSAKLELPPMKYDSAPLLFVRKGIDAATVGLNNRLSKSYSESTSRLTTRACRGVQTRTRSHTADTRHQQFSGLAGARQLHNAILTQSAASSASTLNVVLCGCVVNTPAQTTLQARQMAGTCKLQVRSHG